MNKHLKPGVAVDVRGASDEDVQAVIDACTWLGLNMAKLDSGKGFIVLACGGFHFWECSYECGLPAISINQALGRESEVESKNAIVGQSNASNDWFERGELPPVGTVCQIAPSTEYLHISYPEGSEVKVYSNFTDDRGAELAAFVCSKGKIGGVAIGKCFRPLKTEKEKFVERYVVEICANSVMARASYDKGLRFTE